MPLPDDAINAGFSTGGRFEFSAIYTEQYGSQPAGPLLFMKSLGTRPQGVIDNMECLSVRECLGCRTSDFIKLGFALGLGWN